MKLHSRGVLYWRIFTAIAIASSVVAVSMAIGILGYHYIAGFEWIDALLNAAMILTGMGPVGTLTNDWAKLFASGYALFSGLILVAANGIILAPVFHLVLHRFHADEDDIRRPARRPAGSKSGE
ncbi:MAG: hypothetical protein DVB31_15045 [Verrucomicrobia bacterium]|nr:MAG: hypothetical protein DVB31_15045 [Verrucomicrobiota bacterium]